MELESIRAFVAIVDSGSFSGAAERLHLTQPAVSKRIRTLEAALGEPLFDRLGKGSVLTPAGSTVLPQFRQILAQMAAARQSLDQLRGEVRGRLSLATNHHIGLWRLPPVLRAFTEAYPQVALDLQFMDSVIAEQWVREGRLELAVITLPPQTDARLLAVPVWSDPLEIVVATGHELARHSRVTLEQLAAYPAILPNLTTFTGRIVHDLFRRHQLALTTAISTNYLETIRMLISIGLGWSLLPAIMLDPSVHVLGLAEHRIERQLGYIHLKQKSLSAAARAFVTSLQSASARAV